MYIGLSKALGKVGKFRLFGGIRLTSTNILLLAIPLMFYYMIKLCVYMVVLCGWLIYAMIYGMIWIVKKIINIFQQKKVM